MVLVELFEVFVDSMFTLYSMTRAPSRVLVILNRAGSTRLCTP